jgi:hypothetical protein
MRDADGQRAKIVQAGNFDLARVHGFKDAGHEAERMPWLNSAWSKPSSRISRSMARPSVWRREFQQVENEYMA